MILHFVTDDGVRYTAQWPCTVDDYQHRSANMQQCIRDMARAQVLRLQEVIDDNTGGC
jgi:hypothetical protein